MTFRSGFVSGQALVEGITPYTLRSITTAGSARDWPPDYDADRLTAYDESLALIENRVADVFSRLQLRPDQTSRLILAANLPEFVCNVWPDALWGENAPDVTFEDDGIRDQWDAIWLDNGGDDVLGWEAIFGCAFSGTGVEHVYREDDGRIRIEDIPPGIYFPKLKAGSSRDIEYVTLAWKEDRPGRDDTRLESWQIRKDYTLEGDQLVILARERRLGDTAWTKISELRPDGVDFLPFVDYHAKRWRGRFWGVSELSRNMGLFAEISATLSRIASVLDYHGEPTLQVPASVLFGGVLPKGADRVIGIRNPEEAAIARYIDMPGHVDDQLAEIEKMVDLVLFTAEIQKTYAGGDGDGGASSGTALRLKLQGTLKKMGRWTRKDAARIRSLSDMALALDGVSDPVARIARYTAGNPLPVDDEQEIRILSMMLKDGTISRETYMIQSRRFDDVDEELALIDAEQSETAATSGFGLPPGTPTVPGFTPAPAGLGASVAAAASQLAGGTPPELTPGA